MTRMFEAIQLNHLKAKNRIVRSATWEALANKQGGPTERQMKIYEDLAKGEIGTIITGFTTVSESDYYMDGMARLSNDEVVADWQKLVDITHANGSLIITQLALGEYVCNGRTLTADSATKEDLEALVEMFGEAAIRAKRAGFDGVQIHCAHNFWLSRFISPGYNHRNDEYGYSQENRTRLIVEIYNKLRKVVPDLHITMKINCNDFFSGGLTYEDALITCKTMGDKGIDSIEISGNGTSQSGIKPGVNEAYFLPFAKELKKYSEVPLIVVGGFRSFETVEQVLSETGIEMISISRPLIREPELIHRWKNGNRSPAKCISCNKCYETKGHACIFKLRDEQMK